MIAGDIIHGKRAHFAKVRSRIAEAFERSSPFGALRVRSPIEDEIEQVIDQIEAEEGDIHFRGVRVPLQPLDRRLMQAILGQPRDGRYGPGIRFLSDDDAAEIWGDPEDLVAAMGAAANRIKVRLNTYARPAQLRRIRGRNGEPGGFLLTWPDDQRVAAAA